MKRIVLLFLIFVGSLQDVWADFAPQYFVEIILITKSNEKLHGFVSINDKEIKENDFNFSGEELVVHEKELLSILRNSERQIRLFEYVTPTPMLYVDYERIKLIEPSLIREISTIEVFKMDMNTIVYFKTPLNEKNEYWRLNTSPEFHVLKDFGCDHLVFDYDGNPDLITMINEASALQKEYFLDGTTGAIKNKIKEDWTELIDRICTVRYVVVVEVGCGC